MEDIMKKTLLLGFLGLFLLSLVSSPGIAQDANEILKKMIDAMGGRKVLESVRDTTLTGTWEMTQMGGSGNLTMYQKEPNKMRWDGEMMGMVITMAYDGAMAWWLNPQTGAREDMAESMAEDFKRGAMGNDTLLDPAKFGISFAYKGKEIINNKDYFVLEETYSDGYKTTLYIDPETGLPYKAKSKSMGPGGTEVESESVMSDYRKIDGVMIAHSITIIQGGQEYMRMTFTSVKFNTGLEDSLFKK
jgi:outer membrane lipoprotein-sorting protein